MTEARAIFENTLGLAAVREIKRRDIVEWLRYRADNCPHVRNLFIQHGWGKIWNSCRFVTGNWHG